MFHKSQTYFENTAEMVQDFESVASHFGVLGAVGYWKKEIDSSFIYASQKNTSYLAVIYFS